VQGIEGINHSALNPFLIAELCQNHPEIPWGTRGYLFSHFMSIEPRLESFGHLIDCAERIVRVVWPGAVQEDVDVTSPQSLKHIFSVVSYLTSNNLITGMQIRQFLLWALHREIVVDQLTTFCRTDSAQVRPFTLAILRVTASILDDFSLESSRILRLLTVLCSASREFISGHLAGELLHRIASTRTPESVNMARLLVHYHADVNIARSSLGNGNFFFESPLCAAVAHNAVAMANFLIRAGADVNKRFKNESDSKENTALTIAVQFKHTEMVSLLLDEGAKISWDLTVEGLTILEFAKLHSPRIYNVLKPFAADTTVEMLHLLEAAEKGDRILSKFILEHTVVEEGRLEHALCLAIRLENTGALLTFLQRGVDPDARRYRHACNTTESGKEFEDTRPLISAAIHCSDSKATEIVYLLTKAGAEMNNDIFMRLCRLAVNGRISLLYYLAESGYNIALSGKRLPEAYVSSLALSYS
jgi:hypothetical protein